jgi:hypothetical protein
MKRAISLKPVLIALPALFEFLFGCQQLEETESTDPNQEQRGQQREEPLFPVSHARAMVVADLDPARSQGHTSAESRSPTEGIRSPIAMS